MKVLLTESQYNFILNEEQLTLPQLKGKIERLHGLPKELKDFAVEHVQSYSTAGKGRVSGLSLPSDFKGSLKERNLPDGFDMGVDKNGYYIHTHRARNKSNKDYMKISEKDIKFIDSTG